VYEATFDDRDAVMLPDPSAHVHVGEVGVVECL
jgi:hypothetical protein